MEGVEWLDDVNGMSNNEDDDELDSGRDTLLTRPLPQALHTSYPLSRIRPVGRAKSRRARRRDVAAIVLVTPLALALIVFLTVLVTLVALPIVSQDLAIAPTATIVPWIATQKAALTPVGTDWFTYKNWDAGFQMDMPGVIGSSHGGFINDFSGQAADLYYMGGPLSSPLQRREAQLWVHILYSTKITNLNICPQGGSAVTLGTGKAHIPAWQRNEGRIVALNLVLNGTAIEIDLDSRDDAQPVLAYYSDIWRHMLASFALLPSPLGQTHVATHPCG